MNITFEPLTESHFPLLLKWLETPHVKAWWDQDVKWTKELINDKFSPYVDGWWEAENGQVEKIDAFVICFDSSPIGYIQQYDAYTYLQGKDLFDLPSSLAGVDIFIGDSNFTGKNIGSKALGLFLDHYCSPSFEFAFVDPNANNIAAIKSYTKIGFKQITTNPKTNEICMLKKLR